MRDCQKFIKKWTSDRPTDINPKAGKIQADLLTSFLPSFWKCWRRGSRTCIFQVVLCNSCSIQFHAVKFEIDDCHVDTSSAIVVNQTQSRWFTVQQGVRQGGVLSTFLYLVYINDLIVKIEQSSLHTGILNIPSNCPSLADDLSCIGLTPLSLQNMLNIALAYSRKWRFKFNAQKSCILKFRAKGNRADQDYEWTLGDDVVLCLDV